LHDEEYLRYSAVKEDEDYPDHDVFLSTRTIIILLGTTISCVLAFAIILEIRNFFQKSAQPNQFTGNVYAEVNEICIDENNETL
jgi:hypothetical protein